MSFYDRILQAAANIMFLFAYQLCRWTLPERLLSRQTVILPRRQRCWTAWRPVTSRCQ